MASDDPAALAASTAQGWVVTLNTVARPAPEHLGAAQEALTALTRAEWGQDWSAIQDALSEALEAARARVDGGRPPGSITIAELRGALDELTAIGLQWPEEREPAGPTVPQFVVDGALARGDQQRAELEDQLAAAHERAALQDAELRRQVELRDRFERERDRERRYLKVAHEARAMDLNAAREDSRRAGYIWCLAQLGNSLPGYEQMPTDELWELAVKRLGEVNLESTQLHLVMAEVEKAWRMLSGMVGHWPGDHDPLRAARTVATMAERETRAHEDTAIRLKDAEEALKAERQEHSAPSPDRWAGVLRDRDRLRQRVAELEATLKAERDDYDDDDDDDDDDEEEPGATLSELRSVRAERDELLKARDTQAAELRTLRAERDDAERQLSEFVLRSTVPEPEQ